MTTLLLVRHATNDWVKGHLAGWTPGVHLNEEGKQQAQALSQRMQPLPLTAVYSSPLERAIETAHALADPRNLPVQQVEDVGEVRYGEWNGASLKELAKHELWPGVQFYPSGTRFPGGETLGEVQVRVVAALNQLCANYAETDMIVVVSHADVIKLAVAYYAGIHIDLFQRLEIAPASLTALRFGRMGPRLMTLNATGSLDMLKPPEPEQQETQQEQR